jgi:hypothetical protein
MEIHVLPIVSYNYLSIIYDNNDNPKIEKSIKHCLSYQLL